jgi:hypothetical protein
LDAPIEEQRALLELQRHDSAVDRLNARRGSLSEDARLAELAGGLAAVDQLAAERGGSLATLQRDQARLGARSTSSPERPAARRTGRPPAR